jgi:hypothetical protein
MLIQYLVCRPSNMTRRDDATFETHFHASTRATCRVGTDEDKRTILR